LLTYLPDINYLRSSASKYNANNGYRRIQEIGIEQIARSRGTRMGREKRNIRGTGTLRATEERCVSQF
jgi:hypothetical protein